MEKIKLEIIGMSYSQSQSGAYALILGEKGGTRRLPIIIGGFEAQAIAIELEKMKPTRPLTHDLFLSFANTFNVALKEVIINKFIEGVFHAELVCISNEKEFKIDARTSDAVALSLRFHCPVYTYEKILLAAGIEVDDKISEPELENETATSEDIFSEYSEKDLKELLQKAIDNEEYEKASKIRDELNQRKG